MGNRTEAQLPWISYTTEGLVRKGLSGAPQPVIDLSRLVAKVEMMSPTVSILVNISCSKTREHLVISKIIYINSLKLEF